MSDDDRPRGLSLGRSSGSGIGSNGDGISLGRGWSGEVTRESVCVLSGGGVEPSVDVEIDGDEVLSGCLTGS